MFENEKAWRSEEGIRTQLLTIWQAMRTSIENGLKATGHLPGGLNVRRRAHGLHQQLLSPPQNERLNCIELYCDGLGQFVCRWQ